MCVFCQTRKTWLLEVGHPPIRMTVVIRRLHSKPLPAKGSESNGDLSTTT